MDSKTKNRIFASAKAEFMRHRWETFQDEPPPAEAGGSSIVIPGYPACRKRINTLDEFFRPI